MDFSLLKSVSRSFYLTLRWLPNEVRESISLGYLLARTSDTIADTSSAPVARRLEVLQELRRFDVGTRTVAELARQQKSDDESTLIAALPDFLEQLENSPDRADLEWVWDHILQGQIFDLVRFEPGSAALNPEELDEYTYSVAGSVGEFWTRLCQKRIANFTNHPVEELVDLGIRYGKGLQLVNILRDRNSDAAGGRIYADDTEFAAIKCRAETFLRDGVKWSSLVDNRRIRFACAVPAQIGLATLSRISADSGAVKIPRSELRRIVAGSIPLLWRRRADDGSHGDEIRK